jgi:hypothetical protein
MNPTIRAICKMRADFSKALPVLTEVGVESAPATRTAPFAVIASIAIPTATKVVNTRPGWMGE